MKISYNWLKKIIDFDLNPKKTEELLTDIGLEVEKYEQYENIKGGLKGLVIGEILNVEKHPNADRLNITSVDVGEEKPYNIVCGAPNVAKNQKVVVALPGTTICPINEDSFKIKNAKIRGIDSFGMICAEDEIGIGNDHDGIIVLNNDAYVGTKASEYFNVISDTVFEIGLTPNRADAMSHYGVARDLLAALKYKEGIDLNKKLEKLSSELEIEKKPSTNIKIKILDEEKCYRYSGIVIRNIKVKESPKWLKSKLDSIGLKSINNIVDITNYVLHYLGQPLHAFDLKAIKNNTIKVRCAESNLPFTTLDGNERKLNENDLMICNEDREMCIAGVFGGLDSGVHLSTKDIFIESALFNSVSIRKTAKRHGLNTDASFRYERGVDTRMVIPALIKATKLILEIAGGEVDSEIFDIHPMKIKDKSFTINFKKIRKLCGFSLSDDKMIQLLSYLEIKSTDIKNNTAKVTVPSYRNDVTRESDIAEEILRIYGYNNIETPEKINSSVNFTPLKNSTSLQQTVSNHLTSLGCNEILSNSLSKKSYSEILKATHTNLDSHVQLLNPLSSDTEFLRQSLVYNALEVLNYNNKHGESNCKIFEWGKTYKKHNNRFIEDEHLLIGLVGLQNDEHWFNGKKASSFFQLKGILESIFKLLGVSYQENIFENKGVWDDGIEYKNNKSSLANFGIINKNLSDRIDLKEDCFIAEIYWKPLLDLAIHKYVKFKPINKFQKVHRDLSVLIEEKTKMQELLKCINIKNTSILKSVSLFDIYRDKKNMPNKKSYGLRFEFLHGERTLKDSEVDKTMSKIQTDISKNINASFR